MSPTLDEREEVRALCSRVAPQLDRLMRQIAIPIRGKLRLTAALEAVMFNVLFLIPKTADPQAVDSFITMTVQGMRSQTGQGPVFVSEGALMGPLGRDIPYSRILQTTIDSPGNVISAINSAGAQSSKPVMQQLGVVLLLYETREV